MSTTAKGSFQCPTCGRRFIAPTTPHPRCRTCRNEAHTICRRCNHVRPWASTKLQYCQPCIDFVTFHKSGGISETPTGRLSDRPSRARRLNNPTGPAPESPQPSIPLLPPPPKRSRTSKFAKRMRRRPTTAEKRLGELLTELLPKDGQVQNQWQFACGKKNYILDFYIREVRLGIEVDGAHHKNPDTAHADKAKEECLRERGIHLERITNTQVLKSSDKDLTEWLRNAWREASRHMRASQQGSSDP